MLRTVCPGAARGLAPGCTAARCARSRFRAPGPQRQPRAPLLRPPGRTAVVVRQSPAVTTAAAAPAVVDPVETPQLPLPRPSTRAENNGGQEPFVWTRHWWPLLPEAYLPTDRPIPVTLLGIPLVVWRDGAGSWRVFRDQCPHRLAPLSEGRVESDGTLSCSYHGWRFKGSGACSRIPQATSPAAEATACASRRSCATAFPVRLEAGLLWVWPDEAADAEQAAAASSPLISTGLRQRGEREAANRAAGVVDRSGVQPIHWMMRELPYGYDVLLENISDPCHLPFSHHNVAPGLNRNAAGAFPMQPLTSAVAAAVGIKSVAAAATTATTTTLATAAATVAASKEEEEEGSPEALGQPPALPLSWARPSGPDAEFLLTDNINNDAFKNTSLTVALHMPHSVTYVRRRGEEHINTEEFYLVPVAPGRSRFFNVNRAVVPRPPPGTVPNLKTLGRMLPFLVDPVVAQHLTLMNVLDGDSVFLHVQDKLVRAREAETGRGAASPVVAASSTVEQQQHQQQSGFWSRTYYMPTEADRAILAARRWLDERAGGGPFAERQRQLLAPLRGGGGGGKGQQQQLLGLAGAAVVPGEAPTPEERRSQLLNRYEQHTRHCPHCRSRLGQLQQLAAAAKAAQTALLLAMSVAGGAMGAAAAAAAAAAAGAAGSTAAGAVPAAVSAVAGWPLAVLALCAALWVAADKVASVALEWAQRFVFVDYVHAEKD